MQIKIYLETKDTLSVESSVKNFKSYLKREDSLAEIQKNSYTSFLKYILKLSRIFDKRVHYSREELTVKVSELSKEIESEKQLADKKWLIKQINLSLH